MSHHLAILAYGSLVACAGAELEPVIEDWQPVQTPFEVEYARTSKSRGGAPTLVPVPDGLGSKVKAQILVLRGDVSREEACNMLYRREIDYFGKKAVVYNDKRQRRKEDAVVIETLPDFEGIAELLYVHLPMNIGILEDAQVSAEEKANELARLAEQSVTRETFCSQRDGIRYLADAIRHGIQTPLTEAYRQAILRLAYDAPDLEEARLRIARLRRIICEENDEG